jgi:hypothetical protein
MKGRLAQLGGTLGLVAVVGIVLGCASACSLGNSAEEPPQPTLGLSYRAADADAPERDPELEAILPNSIDAITVTKMSAPAANFTAQGDMCVVFCSHAPELFLESMPAGGRAATAAMGFLEKPRISAVIVVAIRVPSVRTADLIPAWVRAMRMVVTGQAADEPRQDFESINATIAGKHVTIVDAANAHVFELGSAEGVEYLRARDDVLFVVLYEAASTDPEIMAMQRDPASSPPKGVVDLIAALP